MIKKLIIKNFQSHKLTVLKFSPEVNVIVGNSDSGKTSILRALNWVIHNRPSGTAFQSTWGGKTRVTIYTENGFVSRIRSSTDNIYKMKRNRKMYRYTTPGQQVPKLIQKELNFDPVNIQRQFDAPFMLCLSPGERAKEFNKIVRLDIMDRVNVNLNRKLRNEKNTIETREEIVRALQRRRVDDLALEKIKLNTEKLKAKQFELKDLKTVMKNLTKLIEEYQKLKDELGKAESKVKNIGLAEKEVRDLEKMMDDIFLLQQQLEDLETMTSQLKNLEEEEKQKQNDIQIAIKRLDSITPEICPICGKPIKEGEIHNDY